MTSATQPTRWYTSDLHFGHQNIIALGYRPFSNIDEMHAEIVARWNAVVGDDDEVWVLGDLVLGALLENAESYISRLRGRKILVPGNHDWCWQGRGRPRRHDRYLNECGFERIEQNPEPHLIAGEEVAMSHFPYDGDHTAEIRYPEWRPEDNGGWLLHGHVHDLWRQNGRQINVGCDVWDFTPVSDARIAEIISAGPAVSEAA